LRKSSQEKWDEDPIFFEKFSKLVRDTIANFHNGRISDLTYLSTVKELRDKVQSRQDEADPTPVRLRDDGHAQAFWGLAKRNLEKAGAGGIELAADIALEISRIVQKRRKVGWQYDRDVENVIRNDIDDFFFEELRGQRDILIDPAILD
jgi:type I restriction enzyme R subunit